MQLRAHGKDTIALEHVFQATFDEAPVLVQRQYYVSTGYNAEQGRAFYARVIDRVRTMPGVESASLSRRIPLGFSGGSFTGITLIR